MLVADHKHEEVVKLLQQTHSEELMAAKIGHEELAKAKSAVKAEAETARVQQREAAERAAKSAAEEASRLANELAAKEAQLGELQAANATIADGLRAKEEEHRKVIDDLEREEEELERQKEELEDAAVNLADRGEQLHQQVKKLEGNNRVLVDQNKKLIVRSLESGLDVHLHKARDRVGNLERQVADLEAADITTAVSGNKPLSRPPDHRSPLLLGCSLLYSTRYFEARALMLG